jgi:hypothetical protein
MATAAQDQATPATTDPIENWLARRGACPQLDAEKIGSPAPSLRASSPEAQSVRRAPQDQPETASRRTPFCANPKEERAATNRANSQHSTGPRTEPGKQRSSLNALRHGLTAQTAVLPSEDPEAYQRHIQQFLAEYAPATPAETQLVHEIANTAWRLNRIPFLEAELLSAGLISNAPSAQTLIPQLATLGLHGSRLSRQFQKTLEQLRTIQEDRRHLERRQLTEAAELFIRHQRKGLPWEPTDHGFVFSKEQIERHAQKLMLQNPAFYAPPPPFPSGPAAQASTF